MYPKNVSALGFVPEIQWSLVQAIKKQCCNQNIWLQHRFLHNFK